jgi:hypothetical protein
MLQQLAPWPYAAADRQLAICSGKLAIGLYALIDWMTVHTITDVERKYSKI